MVDKTILKVVLLSQIVFLVAACSVFPISTVVVEDAVLPPTQTVAPSTTPTALSTATFTLEPTQTSAATATEIPPPTATQTATAIPGDYKIIPNVVGLHYKEARQVLINAGFTFLYSDVYDPEVPFGTIIEQYPAAGTAERIGEIIFLYRAFQAPGMWVGEKCRSLQLTNTSGKLLFVVYLREGERYEIRTDFPYGRTSISDYRMTLLDSFNNQTKDQMTFEPEWTAWYVLSLGPYEISQHELQKHPDGVPAGCLWVQLLEE